jgi:hypothetical protein
MLKKVVSVTITMTSRLLCPFKKFFIHSQIYKNKHHLHHHQIYIFISQNKMKKEYHKDNIRLIHSRNFRSRIFLCSSWWGWVMGFCMGWLSCLYVFSLFELIEYRQTIMAAEAPKQWIPIRVFWRCDKVGVVKGGR